MSHIRDISSSPFFGPVDGLAYKRPGRGKGLGCVLIPFITPANGFYLVRRTAFRLRIFLKLEDDGRIVCGGWLDYFNDLPTIYFRCNSKELETYTDWSIEPKHEYCNILQEMRSGSLCGCSQCLQEKKMKYPSKERLKRFDEKLNTTEGTLMLGPSSSPAEKFRWELCQHLVRYLV